MLLVILTLKFNILNKSYVVKLNCSVLISIRVLDYVFRDFYDTLTIDKSMLLVLKRLYKTWVLCKYSYKSKCFVFCESIIHLHNTLMFS